MPTTRGQSRSQPLPKRVPSNNNKRNRPKAKSNNPMEPIGVGSAGSTARSSLSPSAWLSPLIEHLPSIAKAVEWPARTWDSPSMPAAANPRLPNSPSPATSTRSVSASSRSPASPVHNSAHPKTLSPAQDEIPLAKILATRGLSIPTLSPKSPAHDRTNPKTPSPAQDEISSAKKAVSEGLSIPTLSPKPTAQDRAPSPNLSVHETPPTLPAQEKTPSPKSKTQPPVEPSPNLSMHETPPNLPAQEKSPNLSVHETPPNLPTQEKTPSPKSKTHPSVDPKQQLTPSQLLEFRKKYHRNTTTLITAQHHLEFLQTCAKEKITPKGLRLNFSPHIYQAKNTNVNNTIKKIIEDTQILLLATIIEHFTDILNEHLESMQESPTYDELLNIAPENITQSDLQQHRSLLKKTKDNIDKKREYFHTTSEKKLDALRNGKDKPSDTQQGKTNGREPGQTFNKRPGRGTATNNNTRHFLSHGRSYRHRDPHSGRIQRKTRPPTQFPHPNSFTRPQDNTQKRTHQTRPHQTRLPQFFRQSQYNVPTLAPPTHTTQPSRPPLLPPPMSLPPPPPWMMGPPPFLQTQFPQTWR